MTPIQTNAPRPWNTFGTILLTVVLMCTLSPTASLAHQEEELQGLRKEMAEIKKDIAMIKLILQRIVDGEAQGSATVSISGRPTLGEHDAPVTIVEFSDYQCPYCRRFATTVFPTLKRDYIDIGKVRYVFRDFPLASHPQAPKAHEAAHCAGEAQRYWEMHDLLFQQQQDFSLPALTRYAQEVGVDGERFEACVHSGKYRADVQRDLAAGTKASVRGTPTFVIGKTEPGSTLTGRIVRGAQPLAKFLQTIKSLQKAPPANPKQPPSDSK